jgi:hypothetical protein
MTTIMDLPAEVLTHLLEPIISNTNFITTTRSVMLTCRMFNEIASDDRYRIPRLEWGARIQHERASGFQATLLNTQKRLTEITSALARVKYSLELETKMHRHTSNNYSEQYNQNRELKTTVAELTMKCRSASSVHHAQAEEIQRLVAFTTELQSRLMEEAPEEDVLIEKASNLLRRRLK